MKFELSAQEIVAGRPNPDCVLRCPVIDIDRQAKDAAKGVITLAERDYIRHVAGSTDCSGLEFDPNKDQIQCPKFGFTSEL